MTAFNVMSDSLTNSSSQVNQNRIDKNAVEKGMNVDGKIVVFRDLTADLPRSCAAGALLDTN
jgi:hypothetical protein